MTFIEAEYADGYIHSEKVLGDVSPYVEAKNVFNDILEKRPEAEHGRMVRFSLFHKGIKYSVDWTILPDNAKPIRYKHMQAVRNIATGDQVVTIEGVDFGYEYIDANGQKQQEIIKV